MNKKEIFNQQVGVILSELTPYELWCNGFNVGLLIDLDDVITSTIEPFHKGEIVFVEDKQGEWIVGVFSEICGHLFSVQINDKECYLFSKCKKFKSII